MGASRKWGGFTAPPLGGGGGGMEEQSGKTTEGKTHSTTMLLTIVRFFRQGAVIKNFIPRSHVSTLVNNEHEFTI